MSRAGGEGENEGRSTVLDRFPFLEDMTVSPIRGGRRAALALLDAIDPASYARSRNFLAGAVTRLSPYLRHGVVSLAEVRDRVLDVVRTPEDAEKLVNELAWRDYWQRLYFELGEDIWTDLEPYKTGWAADSYEDVLPEDVLSSGTELCCMDSFSRDLRETGYLHNHARMWTAAWLVHWRKVRWQAGARWFLEHLLDGDPASNNLSWQWVASTFSQKPYYFNKENLERYTEGRYCRGCALKNNCPLDGSYEGLETSLFRQAAPEGGTRRSLRGEAHTSGAGAGPTQPLVWVHTDDLNPQSTVLRGNPDAPACFVWDTEWLRNGRISGKRVVFIEECLAEMPERVTRREGDIAAELLAQAAQTGAGRIVAVRTPDPRLLAAAAAVRSKLPVEWIDPPPFTDNRSYDLNRFSKYWRAAKQSALRRTT